MSPTELRKITTDLAASQSVAISSVESEDVAALDSGSVREAVRSAINTLGEECISSKSKHINHDRTQSPAADGVVIVCGTAFIMSDAREELGVIEPRDAEELFFSSSQLPPSQSIASNPPHSKNQN